MSRGVSESNNGLRHFGGAADRDELPEMTGRPSYSESRRDALGRMQPSSLRGSEVDSESTFERAVNPNMLNCCSFQCLTVFDARNRVDSILTSRNDRSLFDVLTRGYRSSRQ